MTLDSSKKLGPHWLMLLVLRGHSGSCCSSHLSLHFLQCYRLKAVKIIGLIDYGEKRDLLAVVFSGQLRRWVFLRVGMSAVTI